MGWSGLLGVSAAVVLTAATLLWTVSLRRRDASIVDAFWGPAFALVGALGLALGAAPLARRLLVFALVASWGLRLGLHIHRRNRGQGEDFRYRAMRERHGERFGRVSLFTVFLLQGVLVLVVAQPLLVAAGAAQPVALGGLDLAGAVLWAVGFLFEAVGDAQLARFRADPANRGRVMNRGLWRFTRHPNYFGDALVWWGLGLIGCSAPAGLAALAGPLVMTWLLVRVSGAALLERSLLERKPGYRDYVERTSGFFPWFPRARRDGTSAGPGAAG
jgi:steroid 5-alpha reductase family enzyme